MYPCDTKNGKTHKNQMTNYKYPDRQQKLLPGYFFAGKQSAMHFRPDNSIPETHTVIVQKNK